MTVARQIVWLRFIGRIAGSVFAVLCGVAGLQQILAGNSEAAALWFIVAVLVRVADVIEDGRRPDKEQSE